MDKYEAALESSRRTYGVPSALTTAILGIETGYGKRTGRHIVLDALTTLAFNYPKRAELFRYELEHYLLLTREEGMVPHKMKGSYAGAIGIAQRPKGKPGHLQVPFSSQGGGRIAPENVEAAVAPMHCDRHALGERTV